MAYYRRSNEHQPASEDEARAKFAYFRNAEASIDAGPLAYEPALPLRKRGKAVECGTHSGYKHHIITHTEPCRDCKNARAAYQREYRAGKAAA